MNRIYRRIYRLIWRRVLNGWVAVAEISRGRGKGSGRKLIAAALSLSVAFAQAAPVGGQVVSGAGSVTRSGATTTINQASQNLSLNWQSFNIAASETVNFVQPSASAIAVNRIFDTNGTQILGRLNANGQVYLINPNGILFGQGAQVNVGALVASTLDFNDASLNGSSRTFSANGGSGTGSIVNQGTINATGSGGTGGSGGYVALLGNTVRNQGTITAPQGTVALGAGSSATLTFQNNSLVKMQVDQSVLNSLAENGGLIRADGGLVVLSAGAKNALLASVVNNTGVIEARTVESHAGSIILLGGMAAGTTYVGGTLDASAPNGGNGGFIETSAATVKVADGTRVTTAASAGKTGTWLIDPVDFTIAASSGDITGTALGSLLDSNSITIQTTTGTNTATNRYGSSGTNGDIHVNDAVSWSADNTLTLNAYRNININRSITATGTSGKLALLYGQGSTDGVIGGVTSAYNVNAPVNLSAGPNFSTQLGSGGTVKNYTVITLLGLEGSTTTTDLQGMNGDLTLNYALGRNIDAVATNGWNADAGFTPVGDGSTPFTGTFDGLGHTISTLSINRPTVHYGGLFGVAGHASTIRNVGLEGGSVTGNYSVGGLVGSNEGTVSNSYATGVVSGQMAVGGLVGFNYGTISTSYATGTVRGSYVGGLVGGNGGTVSNSYATGEVRGDVAVGGLVGAGGGTVSNSYATGAVSGGYAVGGLVGSNGGDISNSFATGNVSGVGYVGGLVGSNDGTVSNSYATGAVTGSWNYVGGLVGKNTGTISNSYATGAVTGAAEMVGGLVGFNNGTVSNSYWDIDSTGQSTGGSGVSSGATGIRSASSTLNAYRYNYGGFDFTNTWWMSEDNTRPLLQSEYSTTINNAHQLQLIGMNPTTLAASYTLGGNINLAADLAAVSGQ